MRPGYIRNASMQTRLPVAGRKRLRLALATLRPGVAAAPARRAASLAPARGRRRSRQRAPGGARAPAGGGRPVSDGRRIPAPVLAPARLEAARRDALFCVNVLYGEGVVAVEWLDRLLPAAGDEALPIAPGVTPGGGGAILA